MAILVYVGSRSHSFTFPSYVSAVLPTITLRVIHTGNWWPHLQCKEKRQRFDAFEVQHLSLNASLETLHSMHAKNIQVHTYSLSRFRYTALNVSCVRWSNASLTAMLSVSHSRKHTKRTPLSIQSTAGLKLCPKSFGLSDSFGILSDILCTR